MDRRNPKMFVLGLVLAAVNSCSALVVPDRDHAIFCLITAVMCVFAALLHWKG